MRDVDRDVKVQRKVWFQTTLDPLLEDLQSREAHPSPPTLVRKGCIREAVAENDLAFCESRENYSVQVLAARGEHEQRLGLRVDRVLRVQQQSAKGLSQGRSTRFTGRDDGTSTACEVLA